MQPREKILAAVLGGVVALFLLKALYDKGAGLVEQRQARVVALQRDVNQQKLTIEAGAMAAERIAEWESRSLPSDRDLARTQYHNWLLSLADKTKLKDVDVSGTGGLEHRSGVYHRLDYVVGGRGNLQQLTQFLHEFYAAGHLHQIRTAAVKPTGGDPNDLGLTFTVSALVLPGADREDRLAEGLSSPLARGDLAAYAGIAARRPLEPYTPPPPPPQPRVAREAPRPTPPRPPAFNVAAHAVVTAILGVGDAPQAWVRVRTTEETLKLREGDDFKVGALSGTVVRINGRSMEFTSGGKLHLVALGDSLAKAIVVPDDES